MAVVRNVQFTVWVKIEGRIREVNFRRRSEVFYDGDISDEQNKRWLFKWEIKNGGWDLAGHSEELPVWLINNASVIREGFLTELL